MSHFSFTPLSNDEILAIQNRGLLPEGIYNFKIKSFEEKISNKGNPMYVVGVGIYPKPNEEYVINDYLLLTENMMFKLKHFCEAIGIEDQYNAGKIDINACIGKQGKCKLATQKGKAKEDGYGFYPDRNTIKDYLGLEIVPAEKSSEPDFDDDIKF